MKVAFCNAISIDLSQAKQMIWVSGQLAFDENEQFVGKGDMKAQTEQCMKNIERYLNDLGGSLSDVVQVTVFVKNMDELAGIHEVRLKYFKEPYPTSTLVQITEFVNPDALIEINAMEKSEIESQRYNTFKDIFQPFAIIGLILLIAHTVLTTTWLRRIP